MIKLEHVDKYFGDLHVLKDVNLEVAEGEKLVIIGPSGSGKSTTVRCMNFLEEPTSGHVYIDGKELTEDICNEEIYNAGFAAEPVKLGYDEFFVLGDNRNNSDDSRYSNIGTVKRDMIIGKPWLRIKPASDFGKIKYKGVEFEDDI